MGTGKEHKNVLHSIIYIAPLTAETIINTNTTQCYTNRGNTQFDKQAF